MSFAYEDAVEVKEERGWWECDFWGGIGKAMLNGCA